MYPAHSCWRLQVMLMRDIGSFKTSQSFDSAQVNFFTGLTKLYHTENDALMGSAAFEDVIFCKVSLPHPMRIAPYVSPSTTFKQWECEITSWIALLCSQTPLLLPFLILLPASFTAGTPVRKHVLHS